MRLDDGHSTRMSFAENANVLLYEKTVKPPGIDGGGGTPTTTMLNEEWRTFKPKHLKTLTESTTTNAYDPAVLDQILALVNVNQLITVTFPEGDGWRFWGWVNMFDPNELVEGEQPTAQVTVIPSNENDSGVETPPEYFEA